MNILNSTTVVCIDCDDLAVLTVDLLVVCPRCKQEVPC